MWRLGFFFHEMAFGLLSVFIPLYVVSVGGSIIYVGIASAVAILVAIPSSFFWGYICDKKRRYKRYILLSFLTLSLAIYLLSTSRSIELFIAVYAVMAVFHEASEPPKNVLMAELYPHEEWRKAFALYEAFTEVGWTAGLLLGFTTSFLGFRAESTLILCSILNLAAFATSVFLVSDPLLTIERSLVKIEKNVGLAYRGANLGR
jgi:MFS family permease